LNLSDSVSVLIADKITLLSSMMMTALVGRPEVRSERSFCRLALSLSRFIGVESGLIIAIILSTGTVLPNPTGTRHDLKSESIAKSLNTLLKR